MRQLTIYLILHQYFFSELQVLISYLPPALACLHFLLSFLNFFLHLLSSSVSPSRSFSTFSFLARQKALWFPQSSFWQTASQYLAYLHCLHTNRAESSVSQDQHRVNLIFLKFARNSSSITSP